MKKIFVISEFIAPMQEIGAIRWTKILSYIKEEHDVEITILTTKKNYENKNSVIPLSLKDPYLIDNLSEYKEYYEVPFGKIHMLIYSLVGKKRAQTNDSLDRDINKHSARVDDFINEVTNLRSDFRDYLIAKKTIKYINDLTFDYDVIISSYGPAWPHVVANYIKCKNPNILWIADFRDVYAQDTDGKWGYKRHVKYTKKYCSNADIITCVNSVMNIHENDGQRKVIITNGFDPKEAKEPKIPKKFLCVFTGRMYENRRDLTAFFKAVYELISDNIIDENKIQLAYAGNDYCQFYNQATKYSIGYLTNNFGVLPRNKILEIQSEAAILLQAAWNTKKEKAEWSGKMYEYMMAKKPVVYLVAGDEPYSQPSKLISKIGGVCYEYCRDSETFESMKNYIAQKYLSWNENGIVDIEADKNYIESYSYRNIVEKVWEIIDKEVVS